MRTSFPRIPYIPRLTFPVVPMSHPSGPHFSRTLFVGSVSPLLAARSLAKADPLFFAFFLSYSSFKPLPSSHLRDTQPKSAKISILAPQFLAIPRNPPQVLGSTQKYSPLPQEALGIPLRVSPPPTPHGQGFNSVQNFTKTLPFLCHFQKFPPHAG
jgi:hypothetical protein